MQKKQEIRNDNYTIGFVCYIIFVIVFEVFARLRFSDIWSRIMRLKKHRSAVNS